MTTAHALALPGRPLVLDRLERGVDAFVRAADLQPVPADHRPALEAALHEVLVAVSEAEREGVSARELAALVDPVRAVHARSSVWQRLQSWPRGIAGDAVTLDLLVNGVASSPGGSVARMLEEMLFASPIVEHHALTTMWQRGVFTSHLAARPNQPRVLYLGCGSARDITALGIAAARPDATIVLNDMDGDTLASTARHLEALGWHVQVDIGHASKRMGTLAAEGPFDLVMLGTLPDQLSDAQLEWLLPQALRASAPGGLLCCACAHSPYPTREWLEYCGAWRFFSRSTKQVRQLLKRSGVSRWAALSSPRPELVTLVTVQRP